MRRIYLLGFTGVVVFLVWVLAGNFILAQSNLSTQEAQSIVPRLIRFSGVAREVSGKPMQGIAEMSFSLFKEESGGEPLWFETQTVEADAQGRYTVLLGAMHADGLPMDLFTSGEARWLGVSVGRLPEQPRVLLVAVPYALKAADADTLGGKPATAFVASDQLTDQVRDEVKSQVTESGSATRTLIGTAPTPQAIAETNPATFTCATSGNCVTTTQTGTGDGLRSTALNMAVRGISTATSGSVVAVQGQTSSPTGTGVLGLGLATTGPSYGFRGWSNSTGGFGVHGMAAATSGATYGVWGQSNSPSGYGMTAYASAGTGATTGLRAVVASAAGTAAVIDNLGGGKIISGRTTGYVEKFAVDGGGNVAAAGALSGTQLVSTVASGTAPLTVASNTMVPNLNAEWLDGYKPVDFAPATGSAAYLSKGGDIMTGLLQVQNPGFVVSRFVNDGAGGDHTALLDIQNGDGVIWRAGVGGTGNGLGLSSGHFYIEQHPVGLRMMIDPSGRMAVGNVFPLAQLHVDGPDATDGAGASAFNALLVAGGDGGDQSTSLATAGSGGSITITGGHGGAGTGTDANGGSGGSITLQPGAGGSGDAFAGSAGNVLLAPDGTGSVGIGTSNPGQRLEVNGGVRLNTATAQPACSVITRGTFWITLGTTGVADSVEVCTKDDADAYAWRNVI